MVHNGTTVSQTLPLNSYNAGNAEYGVRSDKLKLVVGTYKVIGYVLYDKLDEKIMAGPGGDNEDFVVIAGGLQEKALTVDAVPRGMLTFKLTKQWANTRATGEYLFSSIRFIDVTLMNAFTRETTELKGMKVTYKEGSKEKVNPAKGYHETSTGNASCKKRAYCCERQRADKRSYRTYPVKGNRRIYQGL